MKEGVHMETTAKLLLRLPLPLKHKLDALKAQGYTASGFIRALLERELKSAPHKKER